jgi:hypothetical protein
MIDAFPSEPSKDHAAATRLSHGRLIVGAVAALAIVAAAFAWRMAGGPPTLASPTTTAAAPARNPVLDQLVEATKALEVSQQQAVDQLQEMQQLLTAERAETKKSSGEVAVLSDKLEALRQSFASMATASPEQADAPQPTTSRPAAHSRAHAHRAASEKAHSAATHE